MNEKAHILVVDDEEQLLDLVRSYLQQKSYRVSTVKNGYDALALIKENEPDLVILDIMMDELDGFTTCEKIREFSSVPILMLTARSGEDDKIKGLKIGADDYIVKPFSLRELTARIEATLRRVNGMKENDEISIGELTIHPSGRLVFVAGEAINVTRKEFDLLLFLVKNRGRVFTREHLHERIWGLDSNARTLRTVDTHIKTLRLKLKTAERFIKTVWGVGYKFEA